MKRKNNNIIKQKGLRVQKLWNMFKTSEKNGSNYQLVCLMFPGASMKEEKIHVGPLPIFSTGTTRFLDVTTLCSWGPTCDKDERFLVFTNHVLVWQRVGESLLVEPWRTYMVSNIQLSTETWNPWTCFLGRNLEARSTQSCTADFLPELHKVFI